MLPDIMKKQHIITIKPHGITVPVILNVHRITHMQRMDMHCMPNGTLTLQASAVSQSVKATPIRSRVLVSNGFGINMRRTSWRGLRNAFDSEAPLGHARDAHRQMASDRNLPEQGFH